MKLMQRSWVWGDSEHSPDANEAERSAQVENEPGKTYHKSIRQSRRDPSCTLAITLGTKPAAIAEKSGASQACPGLHTVNCHKNCSTENASCLRSNAPKIPPKQPRTKRENAIPTVAHVSYLRNFPSCACFEPSF